MWRSDWITKLLEEHRRKQDAVELRKKEIAAEERELRREGREARTLEINRGLFWATLASALVAVIALVLTSWQAWQSRRDAEQAQKNFEITRQDAKDSAAQARQDALDSINKQLDAQRELRDQAARSAKAAESTAAISTQSFHVSERAYVLLTPILGRPLAVRTQTLLSVSIANSGRTPALGLSTTTCVTDALPSTPIEDVHAFTLSGRARKFSAGAVSLPAGKRFEQNATTENLLKEDEFDDLKAGKKVLYLFSRATYKDIFGNLHHEEICGQLNPNLRQLDTCRVLNKSD